MTDTPAVSDLADLTARMREFTKAREWARFHDLKSLTLALVGEVGEVAELVQWLPAGAAVDDGLRARLGDELADVLLYLLRLADVAGVDLGTAAISKLARTRSGFPWRSTGASRRSAVERAPRKPWPPLRAGAARLCGCSRVRGLMPGGGRVWSLSDE